MVNPTEASDTSRCVLQGWRVQIKLSSVSTTAPHATVLRTARRVGFSSPGQSNPNSNTTTGGGQKCASLSLSLSLANYQGVIFVANAEPEIGGKLSPSPGTHRESGWDAPACARRSVCDFSGLETCIHVQQLSQHGLRKFPHRPR